MVRGGMQLGCGHSTFSPQDLACASSASLPLFVTARGTQSIGQQAAGAKRVKAQSASLEQGESSAAAGGSAGAARDCAAAAAAACDAVIGPVASARGDTGAAAIGFAAAGAASGADGAAAAVPAASSPAAGAAASFCAEAPAKEM